MIRCAWGYVVMAIGAAWLAVICFTWAVASVILGVVLPERMKRSVGRTAATWWFRVYLGSMEAIGAWRLDIEALDELRTAGPLIIAPNHPCLLDAVLVVSRLPNAVCVMKRSLLASFLLGPASRLAGYVRNDSLIRLVSSAQAELREGGQLLIFPEGTRSTAHPTGPFTDAVGAISRRAGVPVQTVIIEADASFLGKGWTPATAPRLPLAYRARLGRRFDPPRDVRDFTAELERYFARELAHPGASAGVGLAVAPVVEDAHRLRG